MFGCDQHFIGAVAAVADALRDLEAISEDRDLCGLAT
jgi:hypothetical protein